MKNYIMIFGDICPDNDYRSLFDQREYGAFSEEIARDIQNASLVIGNLECPATENNEKIRKCGPHLKAIPKDIELLKRMGFNILSLANNHILDYGIAGLKETLKKCGEQEIAVAGVLTDSSKENIPVISEVNGKKIGLLSYGEAEFNLATEKEAGSAHFDPYSSLDEIKKAKENCDYLIVLYHGGIEHYKYPSPMLSKKCRKMAEYGADLVLCQHSHCIGTVEKVGSSVILYGQGNSVFGYREGNNSWNEGFVLKINADDMSNIEFKLMNAQKDGIVYASEGNSHKRVKEMLVDSEKLKEDGFIKESFKEFALKQAPLDYSLLYGKNRIFNKLNRILGNRLIELFYPKDKQRITMNLIRCEAHNEVVLTMLENKVFNK